MLRAVVEFCVRERLIVLLFAAAVITFGVYSYDQVPIDAIPDIGENQVIVFTPWPGRSPKDVEDQVTYPLSVALSGVPGAESVRGKSLFGTSFVQVTFKDDVDFYWARSRVAEQLSTAQSSMPDGVTPTLGPDATGLGQILYYTLSPPVRRASSLPSAGSEAERAHDGNAKSFDLSELRSLQDYVVKYELQSVEGVSEVATVGGYVRQYQIEIDPDRLRFHNIPLDKVIRAIKGSNLDVGAKTVEAGGMEYIIRGKGFIGADKDLQQAVADIERTVILTRDGVPIRIRDVADVQLGPDFRRGAIDLNGSEAVGGVVVMRYGENPRKVIERVKEKIKAVEPSLKGAKINIVYDRTGLIDETVGTLSTALIDETLITVVVIFLFLLHVRSSLVVAVTLPIAVLIAFIAMNVYGVDANIMSLAGIAIAIGTMVDMGIIVSENIYQHLSEKQHLFAASETSSSGELIRATSAEVNNEPNSDVKSQAKSKPSSDVIGHAKSETLNDEPSSLSRLQVIVEATCEVAPAVISAVATTVISFLPVFFLTGRDHKLFAPLAWTKSFALVASLIVAVLLVPLLSRLLLTSKRPSRWLQWSAPLWFGGILGSTTWFVWRDALQERWELNPVWMTVLAVVLGTTLGWLMTRERLRSIEENPVSRGINWVYEPTLRFFLAHRMLFGILPVSVFVLGLGAWIGLPTVLQPVEKVAQSAGANLNEFPGYVDFKHSFTGLESDDWIALDEGGWFYMPTLYPAASFSQAMQVLQTQDELISQIPEVENVLGKIGRVESALDPAPAAMVETYVMLKPKKEWRPGITAADVWDQINQVATLPGVTPASALQPIEGRVVMLQSGIKAPMAIRVYGDDLEGLAKASRAVAEQLKQNPYVDAATVNPDIVMGKPYVEFEVDRDAAARYEMSTQMVNQIIESALGGMNLTTTYEGRERYPIRLRYQRNLRERIDELERLPVVTHTGEVVPLKALASMKTTWGPGAINSENARLVAHVSFATSGIAGDLESVAAIEQALHQAQRAHADASKSAAKNHSTERAIEIASSHSKEDALVKPLALPDGYVLEAVGSFQNQIEANNRLMWLVPLVVLVNLLIIYLQFRNLPITLTVFAGIPVSFGGGMILLGILDVEMNTAIWVGFIALFGIAVDDGVVMATYLQQVFETRQPKTIREIRDATVEAGLRRIRPCLMTTVTTVAALIPVLVSDGRGADVARAMALPVFGGMLFELIRLFGVPVSFCAYQEFKLHSQTNQVLTFEPPPEELEYESTETQAA